MTDENIEDDWGDDRDQNGAGSQKVEDPAESKTDIESNLTSLHESDPYGSLAAADNDRSDESSDVDQDNEEMSYENESFGMPIVRKPQLEQHLLLTASSEYVQKRHFGYLFTTATNDG